MIKKLKMVLIVLSILIFILFTFIMITEFFINKFYEPYVEIWDIPRVNKMYSDIKNKGTFKEDYFALIKNLDFKSIMNVTYILYQINDINTKNHPRFTLCHYFIQKHMSKFNNPGYKAVLDSINNKEYLKNKDIIDAGAYDGDTAVLFSNYTNKKVYSFEPSSQNYELLITNIKQHYLKKVTPIKLALGDSNSPLYLFNEKCCSKIISKNDIGKTKSECHISIPEQKRIELVNSITIDNFVKKNNLNIGLIKVDIEGFEQKLLKGAEETIKKQRPILIISIYHNEDDFFNIKKTIENWNLNYKFRINRGPFYKYIVTETLLIAEPLSY